MVDLGLGQNRLRLGQLGLGLGHMGSGLGQGSAGLGQGGGAGAGVEFAQHVAGCDKAALAARLRNHRAGGLGLHLDLAGGAGLATQDHGAVDGARGRPQRHHPNGGAGLGRGGGRLGGRGGRGGGAGRALRESQQFIPFEDGEEQKSRHQKGSQKGDRSHRGHPLEAVS